MILTTSSRRASGRSAFTLVEMLVVIGIIVTLIAITGVALQKTLENQKNRSSTDQLFKLQQSLDAEYEAVVRQCAQDQQNKKIPQLVVDYCEGDLNRALSVWTAMNLRKQFPESFTEATTPFSLGGYTLKPHAAFGEVSTASGVPAGEESAVLLYIILAKKSVGGAGAMSASADDLTQGMQRQVSGKNTFADAWGNSVGFSRWYSGSTQDPDVQNPPYATSTSGNKDPLDTRSLVLNWVSPDSTKDVNALRSALLFNGKNRLATVYTAGKNHAMPDDDDLLGYRLRKYGNRAIIKNEER